MVPAQFDGPASRARIHEAVRQDPGLHVSEIAERTSLSWHTVIHHLHVMERQGRLVLHKSGRDRAVFPASVPARMRRLLVAVRVGQARVILRHLVAGQAGLISGLAEATGCTTKVVRRRIADLEKAGLVERRGLWRPSYHVPASLVPWLTDVLDAGPGGSSLGSWTLDPKDCRAELSPEAIEVLGLAPVPGDSLEDFVTAHVHPDDLSGLVAVVRGALAASRPYEHAFRIRTPAGERVIRQRGWVSARGADGRARQFKGTLEDVTLAHQRPGARRRHAKPAFAHGAATGAARQA